MDDVQNTTETSPLLLSIKSLAHKLGVCERTIRTMRSVGEIPEPLKVRGRVLWKFEEIQAWVNAGCPRCRDGQP